MVNKVILVGRLGKDPEVKHTTSGIAVAQFSLATDEKYKDKAGEWQDATEWHNIVAFQKNAENVGKYLSKGSLVYIEGKAKTRSWEDKSTGQKKYKTEIEAAVIKFLDSKPKEEKSLEITDDDIPF